VGNSASTNIPDAGREPRSPFDRWRALAMNVWIVAVILLFFVLRVFDSNTARRIFHSLAVR
jgi:hypothetical protein